MKIIFDFQNMIGGAPRSQLAHMLCMRKSGQQVVATIGKDAEELKALIHGIKIIEIDNFSVKEPFNNINTIRKWGKIIKSEKPDIIHSNRVMQSQFLRVVSDWFGVPLVFAQAGGVATESLPRLLENKTAICYSIENKEEFLKYGFKEKNIFIISNRIPYPKLVNKVNHPQRKECLDILLSGNIKVGTIDGLIKFLDYILSIKDIERNFSIRIAGKDITPKRMFHDALTNKIAEVNKKIGDYGFVKHLGWVDNISDFQMSADICIGKGRSVVQAAIVGKICFVLAESGKLTRICNDNFESLYKYNFSGRGNQRNDIADLTELISEKEILSRYANEAEDVSKKVCNFYLEDGAYHKLLHAYKSAIQDQRQSPQKFPAVKKMLQIYTYVIKNKIKRWVTNSD